MKFDLIFMCSSGYIGTMWAAMKRLKQTLVMPVKLKWRNRRLDGECLP